MPSTTHEVSTEPQETGFLHRLPSNGAARARLRRRREWRARTSAVGSKAKIAVSALAFAAALMIVLRLGSHPPSDARLDSPVSAVGTQASARPLPAIPAWNGNRRFTVLVMGIERVPPEAGDELNTDTIMLVSINPANASVGILSIPRDLFVPLPGQADLHRIDSIYAIGELQQPGSGPTLLSQAIRYNFAISTNAFVVVSYATLVNLVDDIGGIDIDVPTAIDDPQFPDTHNGYDPLHIPAGVIHMDGALALKYARTRHQDSDYDRTRRQQQVMLAVRKKATQPQLLAQLAAQAPGLWNQVNTGILTDLTFDQVLSLGWYAKDIPPGNIQRATIDGSYVQAIQYQGNAVVIPNRSTIAALMAQVFGPDYSRS